MVSISPFRTLAAGALLSFGAALLISASGCGGGDSAPSSPAAPSSTSAPDTSTDEPAAADETEPSAAESPEATSKSAKTEDPKPAKTESAEAGGTGTLSGVVTLKGEWTPLAPLFEKGDETVKDAAVCSAETIPNQSVLVNTEAGNGVANVFIYLSKVPRGTEVPDVPEEPLVIDQKGCVFLPRTLLVRQGQKILVKSMDAVPHNVHTFPKLAASFNSICPPNERNGLELVYAAEEREPVSVKCDIHPWMQGWHLPLDHPFAAITDSEGKFSIENVPSGDLKFRVWHEKAGFIEKSLEVSVKADETNELNIELSTDQLAGMVQPARTIVLK
ncbi:MAG: hypothetical protein ACYTGL_21505 [Planctomycetota bacterium]|jgi:plastocyanin